MRDHKPSDFTGEDDEKNNRKSTKREFLELMSVGGASTVAGYLGYENRDRIFGEDEYVCIEGQVLLRSTFGEEGSYEPNSEGYHKFRYDARRDQWYEQNTQSGSEMEEREANSEEIEEILEDTGDSFSPYTWGEEVLEGC